MNTAVTTDRYSAVTKEMKDFVLDRCEADENMMSGEYYGVHLRFVEEYAEKLAPLFGARPELVKLAAISHDLGAIMYYSTLAQHHMKGADITAGFLSEKIPDADIATITDAIRNHNLPVSCGTPEAIVLSHADALSKFDSPVYWISYAWKRRFDSFGESVTWYRELLEKTYGMMDPKARVFIEEKYASVKILLQALQQNA